MARALTDTHAVHPVKVEHRGHSVPLWHNKDKSENPCGATGWLVCPNPFSINFPAESRHNEGCQKVRCTIRDKENEYYPAGVSASRLGAFYQQETGRWAVSFGSVSNPPRQTGAGPSGHLIVQVKLTLSERQRTRATPLYPPAGVYLCALRACRPDR